MATFFVDSNATGANDGSSFADAFTSITSVAEDVPAAGDQVLIASNHSEALAAAIVLGTATDGDDWVDYISVNSGTEEFETGATVTSTANIDFNNAEVRGLTLSTTAEINLDLNGGASAYDCSLTCNRLDVLGRGYLENCITTITGTTAAFRDVARSLEVVGGSVIAASVNSNQSLVSFGGGGAGYIDMFGVDTSGVNAGNFIFGVSTNRGRRLRMVGCVLGPNLADAFTEAVGRMELELINCGAGTSTVSTIGYRYENRQGRCELDTTRTRTGGATDGETAHSLRLTALADQTRKSTKAAKSGIFGVTQWVEPGDTNLRIHIAHDAVGSGAAGVLQSNECWGEYRGPSQAGTATFQLEALDSRTEFGVTPTDLTTDSAVWSGTEVGTVQRIDIPINPTEAGYAQVLLHLAPESVADVSVNFCPKIEVT